VTDDLLTGVLRRVPTVVHFGVDLAICSLLDLCRHRSEISPCGASFSFVPIEIPGVLVQVKSRRVVGCVGGSGTSHGPTASLYLARRVPSVLDQHGYSLPPIGGVRILSPGAGIEGAAGRGPQHEETIVGQEGRWGSLACLAPPIRWARHLVLEFQYW